MAAKEDIQRGLHAIQYCNDFLDQSALYSGYLKDYINPYDDWVAKWDDDIETILLGGGVSDEYINRVCLQLIFIFDTITTFHI